MVVGVIVGFVILGLMLAAALIRVFVRRRKAKGQLR